MFKDDPLLSSPGASYLYTTHGWTLLSAVVESISGQDFLLYMKKLFKDLGMENTGAEFNDTIILNRARLSYVTWCKQSIRIYQIFLDINTNHYICSQHSLLIQTL